MTRFFFALIVLLVAGCRQSAAPPDVQVQDVQMTLAFEPDPPLVGEATLRVTVTQAGAPLANAPVAVRGDMNHAGMVPVLRDAATDASGVASLPFEWTMGGEWIVTVTVTLPDGAEAAQTFDVVVGS